MKKCAGGKIYLIYDFLTSIFFLNNIFIFANEEVRNY